MMFKTFSLSSYLIQNFWVKLLLYFLDELRRDSFFIVSEVFFYFFEFNPKLLLKALFQASNIEVKEGIKMVRFFGNFFNNFVIFNKYLIFQLPHLIFDLLSIFV